MALARDLLGHMTSHVLHAPSPNIRLIAAEI